jgi:hypothetical protein
MEATMLFPPEVKVTTDVLWRGAVIFLLLDSGFVFLLVRRTKALLFRQCKWTLVCSTVIFWGLMWTAMMSFFWEPVYQYVFPDWSRWLIPPVYALFFGLVGLLFWWLALRLPGNPVMGFLLLGGLWGSLTHVWAISRGILDKPPMLQGASPSAAVVLPFFEFVFYWCIILAVSTSVYSWWITARTTTNTGAG